MFLLLRSLKSTHTALKHYCYLSTVQETALGHLKMQNYERYQRSVYLVAKTLLAIGKWQNLKYRTESMEDDALTHHMDYMEL